MSGAVSAIGKIFTPLFSGVKSVIGSAVGAVGATVATSTAANLGKAAIVGAGGGMLGSASTGVLSSMLGGAARVAGAAFSHSLGGGAADATTAATAGSSGLGSDLMDFLKSEGGAGLVAGIGGGLGEYEKAQMEAEEKQKDRDYLLGKEQRLRDSYKIDPSAIPNGASTGVVQDDTQRPTPAQAYARQGQPTQAGPRVDTPWYWHYDPETKRTVRVPAGAV